MEADYALLCRVCARNTRGKGTSEPEAISILNTNGLKEKLEKFLYVKVLDDDLFPKVLCQKCFRHVENTASLSAVAASTITLFKGFLDTFVVRYGTSPHKRSSANLNSNITDLTNELSNSPPSSNASIGASTSQAAVAKGFQTEQNKNIHGSINSTIFNSANINGGARNADALNSNTQNTGTKSSSTLNLDALNSVGTLNAGDSNSSSLSNTSAINSKKNNISYSNNSNNINTSLISLPSTSKSPPTTVLKTPTPPQADDIPTTSAAAAAATAAATFLPPPSRSDLIVNVSVSDPLTCETQDKILKASRRKLRKSTPPPSAVTAAYRAASAAYRAAGTATASDTAFAPKSIAQSNPKLSPFALLKLFKTPTTAEAQASKGDDSHRAPKPAVPVPELWLPQLRHKSATAKRSVLKSVPQTHQPGIAVEPQQVPTVVVDDDNDNDASVQELPDRIIIAAAKKKKTVSNTRQPSTTATKSKTPKPQEQLQPVPQQQQQLYSNMNEYDIKLGKVIKDIDLLKLILIALKWPKENTTSEEQIAKLKNSKFIDILNDTNLLQDTDVMQILGPYLTPNIIQTHLEALQRKNAEEKEKLVVDEVTTVSTATTGTASNSFHPIPTIGNLQITNIPYKLPAETSVQLVPSSPTDSSEESNKSVDDRSRHTKNQKRNKLSLTKGATKRSLLDTSDNLKDTHLPSPPNASVNDDDDDDDVICLDGPPSALPLLMGISKNPPVPPITRPIIKHRKSQMQNAKKVNGKPEVQLSANQQQQQQDQKDTNNSQVSTSMIPWPFSVLSDNLTNEKEPEYTTVKSKTIVTTTVTSSSNSELINATADATGSSKSKKISTNAGGISKLSKKAPKTKCAKKLASVTGARGSSKLAKTSTITTGSLTFTQDSANASGNTNLGEISLSTIGNSSLTKAFPGNSVGNTFLAGIGSSGNPNLVHISNNAISGNFNLAPISNSTTHNAELASTEVQTNDSTYSFNALPNGHAYSANLSSKLTIANTNLGVSHIKNSVNSESANNNPASTDGSTKLANTSGNTELTNANNASTFKPSTTPKSSKTSGVNRLGKELLQAMGMEDKGYTDETAALEISKKIRHKINTTMKQHMNLFNKNDTKEEVKSTATPPVTPAHEKIKVKEILVAGKELKGSSLTQRQLLGDVDVEEQINKVELVVEEGNAPVISVSDMDKKIIAESEKKQSKNSTGEKRVIVMNLEEAVANTVSPTNCILRRTQKSVAIKAAVKSPDHPEKVTSTKENKHANSTPVKNKTSNDFDYAIINAIGSSGSSSCQLLCSEYYNPDEYEVSIETEGVVNIDDIIHGTSDATAATAAVSVPITSKTLDNITSTDAELDVVASLTVDNKSGMVAPQTETTAATLKQPAPPLPKKRGRKRKADKIDGEKMVDDHNTENELQSKQPSENDSFNSSATTSLTGFSKSNTLRPLRASKSMSKYYKQTSNKDSNDHRGPATRRKTRRS